MHSNSLHDLAELGRLALAAADLSGTVQLALALVRRALSTDGCDLVAISEEGSAVLFAWCADGQCRCDETPLRIGDQSPVGRVLQTQLPLAISNANEMPTEVCLPHASGMASSLHVPLLGQDRPLGVLGAYWRGHRSISAADADFLQVITHLLATACQRNAQASRRREKQMLRAEQMMAIGQVAAGVAHELRNPLTSIKGLIQVNLREAVARGFPSDDLAIIEHEIRRMERTLQTFLDFARPPKPDFKPLDLQEIVQRVVSLVAGRARKQNVALRSTCDRQTTVSADQDQLQQLLLNLVLNALDAMPDGGDINVEILVPRDGFVEVVLRDSGPGIPAEVLPKVFESFVSSKETGVGLGLPVSLRIAENHGGTLHAYNHPGGGACFVLRLPFSE
jgi:signal transduction histidine kinase